MARPIEPPPLSTKRIAVHCVAATQASPDPALLLAVGMMRSKDKLDSYRLLADALQRVKCRDWHLAIAGDGALIGEAKAAFGPLRDRVTFLGRVPYERLPALYAGANLLVWPAIKEALGMCFLEAQAAGTPVIGANREGVASLIRDGETGLLPDYGDAAAFARAIETLLGDRARLRSMRTAASRNADEYHDLATAGPRFAALVASALPEDGMSRVLFHVQHLLGVGHVARAAALTRGMRAAGLDVTVVMGGEPVPNVDFGGAELVQLPWVRASDTSFKTLLDSAGRPVDAAFFEHRRDLLLDLFATRKPDALLIEHFPFGRRKFGVELEPLIAAAKTQEAPVFCSLRDVLVEKGEGAKSAKAIAIIQKSFDKVLVHGDPSVLGLEQTFPCATEIAGRIAYTGYVVDRRDRPSSSGDPADGHDEIIVSIGGGAVGLDLIEGGHRRETAWSRWK